MADPSYPDDLLYHSEHDWARLDGDSATFAYTVTLGSPPVTVTQAKQLTRLVFRAPGTVCR